MAIRQHRLGFDLILLIAAITLLLAACGPDASDLVPVTDLPDPAIYGLSLEELPEVYLPWKQTYNQSQIDQGYKWSYLAYQAYQPGSLSGELESGFAINNDIYLYEVDISHEDLPQPPQTIGNLQNITWKRAAQTQRLGNKSAVWKTTIGELFTPAWRLEFYQGHAFVCISLFGFPDQIAPAIIYGLGDILSARLPNSVAVLRSDAATQIATQPLPTITASPQPTLPPDEIPPTQALSMTSAPEYLNPKGYTAPPGETGMVQFFDETGTQLSDGMLGGDDILANLGHGTAYEWVGWIDDTDPITLTFTFTGKVSISAVEIGINHRDGLGIFVPSSISINGQNFDLSADAVGNNQRGELVLSGPFYGPIVTIALHHRGHGWILVDEVRFVPVEQ